MTTENVLVSLCNYAKVFVREYRNDEIEQDQIDSIVVDFINHYALMQTSLDLNFSLEDLHSEKETENTISSADLDKEAIGLTLEYWREDLCLDDNTLKIISEFIKGYLSF